MKEIIKKMSAMLTVFCSYIRINILSAKTTI